MRKSTIVAGVFATVFASMASAAGPHRIGVLLEGGPNYLAVDGLKEGLKELGFAEGRDYILDIRDLKGSRTAAAPAAADLEKRKVELLYTLSSTLTLAAQRATASVPIVFAVGSDPVANKLVDSFARPGGRMTGVYYSSRDVIPKRLDIL